MVQRRLTGVFAGCACNPVRNVVTKFTMWKSGKNNVTIISKPHANPRRGWVWRRCRVSYVTGAPNWYWLPVGQGLLSFVASKDRGECFYFFCFFTFIPLPNSSLSLSFISSTISSISFLPLSGSRHKMTHKGWRVVKPQHNQKHAHPHTMKKTHAKFQNDTKL